MIQEAWRGIGLGHRTALTLQRGWNKLEEEYNKVALVPFLRCDPDSDITQQQLHVFCDASSKADGALAYLIPDSD